MSPSGRLLKLIETYNMNEVSLEWIEKIKRTNGQS